MDQQDLWHDRIEEALQAVVVALGGPKKTGMLLWPSKTPADAARLLNHCLDPERNEKLSLAEIMLLLREGRRAGCHTATVFICRDAGYQDPLPIEPENEMARLQRDYIESVERMEKLTREMRRMQLQALEGGRG